MGRISVRSAQAARSGDAFVEALGRRVESMPPGQCPVALMIGQLQLSQAQTCGKCTPCAQGMPKIERLLRAVADFGADEAAVAEIRAAATLLRDTADCAVGWQPSDRTVLSGWITQCFPSSHAWRDHIEKLRPFAFGRILGK